MKRNYQTILLYSIFFLFILTPFALSAQTTKVYGITVEYNKGEVKIGQVYVKQGGTSRHSDNIGYDYKIELIDFKNKVLESVLFSIPVVIAPFVPEGAEPTPPPLIEKTAKNIHIAYHKNGYLLRLYDNNTGELLDEKSVAIFADMCGDGECQEGEFFINCSNDCPAGGLDGWCNQEMMEEDPDCQQDAGGAPAEPEEKAKIFTLKNVMMVLGLLILGIILVIVGVVFYRKEYQNF